MDTAQMYHLQGDAFPKSAATEISDGETIVSLPIDSTYKENDEPTEVLIQYCNTAGTVSKAQTLSRPLAEY